METIIGGVVEGSIPPFPLRTRQMTMVDEHLASLSVEVWLSRGLTLSPSFIDNFT